MKPSTMLRQIMAEGKTVVKPGVYDAMGARILEGCGFQAVGISGYSVSVTSLGRPDLGFISLTDMERICRSVCSSISIPVIADADTGFGNAINVLYTTEALIRAGVAAFHMEDQEFPKRCGHVSGKTVISTQEMAGKIKAAVRIRDEMDKDVVIIARCDVRGTAGGSLEKLIERCNAYVDAGADMIFPEGIPNEEELRIVAERVKAPIHYNRTGGAKRGGISPLIPLSTLQDIGICMASQAVGPMLAAAKAIWEWGTCTMKNDVEFLQEQLEGLAGTPMSNLHTFSGMDKYLEMEKLYLPDDNEERYAGSLGFSKEQC